MMAISASACSLYQTVPRKGYQLNQSLYISQMDFNGNSQFVALVGGLRVGGKHTRSFANVGSEEMSRHVGKVCQRSKATAGHNQLPSPSVLQPLFALRNSACLTTSVGQFPYF